MDCGVVVARIEHETTKVLHDASYLTELECLATSRYTVEDLEYMQEVNDESPAPPLVAPEARAGGGHRYNRGGGRGGDWRQRDHHRDGGDRRQNIDRSRDGGDWQHQGDRNRDGGDWRQQRDHSRDGRSRGGGGGGDYYNNRESNRSNGGSYNRHYQQGDDNGHGGYHRSNVFGGRGGDAGQHRDNRDGPYNASGARGETEQNRYRNFDQRSGSNRDQNR